MLVINLADVDVVQFELFVVPFRIVKIHFHIVHKYILFNPKHRKLYPKKKLAMFIFDKTPYFVYP